MNIYLVISLLIPIALIFWVIILNYHLSRKLRSLKSQISNLSLAQKNSFSTFIEGFDTRLVDLITRIDRISEELYSFNECLLSIQDNLLNELDTRSDMCQKSILSALDIINSNIDQISNPIQELAKAKTNTIIKKGESNRSLYRRIEILNKNNSNLQSALELTSKELNSTKLELDELKSLSQSYIKSLYHEIDFIRDWMDKNGLPLISLDKELNLQFRNNIPSRELRKILNQKNLKEYINA